MTARADEPHIGLVVEGRGDQFAVPLMLRAHLQQQNEFRDVLGPPVVCHGRDKAIMAEGLEGFVATASGRPGCVGILVVLDAERDRACELGPALLARATVVTAKPVKICLAEPQFEAWLVASAETMELDELTYDQSRNPESLIRQALDVNYIKPTWQPRLTARIDLGLASGRSQSLHRTLEGLDSLAERLNDAN
jgi:hypothetical protein